MADWVVRQMDGQNTWSFSIKYLKTQKTSLDPKGSQACHVLYVYITYAKEDFRYGWWATWTWRDPAQCSKAELNATGRNIPFCLPINSGSRSLFTRFARKRSQVVISGRRHLRWMSESAADGAVTEGPRHGHR
jgi:hypothetical protein